MKSISFKEDWHGVKSTAQDIDIWTFLVTSSGVSVLGRAKLFLKGNVGWLFIFLWLFYFLCGREVMLAIEAQHSCPQWPPSAALCPGCCPLQKLDAQVVVQPWP